MLGLFSLSYYLSMFVALDKGEILAHYWEGISHQVFNFLQNHSISMCC